MSIMFARVSPRARRRRVVPSGAEAIAGSSLAWAVRERVDAWRLGVGDRDRAGFSSVEHLLSFDGDARGSISRPDARLREQLAVAPMASRDADAVGALVGDKLTQRGELGGDGPVEIVGARHDPNFSLCTSEGRRRR